MKEATQSPHVMEASFPRGTRVVFLETLLVVTTSAYVTKQNIQANTIHHLASVTAINVRICRFKVYLVILLVSRRVNTRPFRSFWY